MAIGFEFNFLKIIGGRESRNWKSIPKETRTRKETLRVEHHTVASIQFNGKTLRPIYQSSRKFKFMQSIHHGAKHRSTIPMNSHENSYRNRRFISVPDGFFEKYF